MGVEGNAKIVRDKAAFADLWMSDLERWFPAGIDTQGMVMIQVHADRINIPMACLQAHHRHRLFERSAHPANTRCRLSRVGQQRIAVCGNGARTDFCGGGELRPYHDPM